MQSCGNLCENQVLRFSQIESFKGVDLSTQNTLVVTLTPVFLQWMSKTAMVGTSEVQTGDTYRQPNKIMVYISHFSQVTGFGLEHSQ